MKVRARQASDLIRTVLAALALGAASGGHAEETAGAAAAPTSATARQASRAAAAADAEPTATQPAAVALRPRPKAAAASGRGREARTMDTLELDTTQITGNRELPKVMVVVPWKRSDIGDLVGRPVNSLVDEALAPVDREVFRREIAYYGALAPDQRNETPVTPGASGAPAVKPEK